jgi:hypothetical protein
MGILVSAFVQLTQSLKVNECIFEHTVLMGYYTFIKHCLNDQRNKMALKGKESRVEAAL